MNTAVSNSPAARRFSHSIAMHVRNASALTIVILLIQVVMAAHATAQTLTVIHSFSGTDGAGPVGGLSLGQDGLLYGTTAGGSGNAGSSSNPCGVSGDFLLFGFSVSGCGSVFKISTAGALTPVFSNVGFELFPNTPVIDLNFTHDNIGTYNVYFGVAGDQGSLDPTKLSSLGRVFDVLAPNNTEAGWVNCGFGQSYAVPVVFGQDGSVYGTTLPTNGGPGTAFKITNPTAENGACANWLTSGTFLGSASPLIQASDGSFYGVDPFGGANGFGAVFKITLSGALTTLYSFTDSTDGAGPISALIFGGDGNLYGTTTGGCAGISNASINNGTIFRVTTTGSLTTLYTFPNTGVNPQCPSSPLVQGTDGSFFGTTAQGGTGSSPQGAIFNFIPGGVMSTLYTFATPTTTGGQPMGSIVLNSANSTIYGGTAYGGASNDGVIYSFSFPPIANLSIQGSGSLSQGVATYKLMVSNAGPDSATSVTVKETLPTGVTLVTASSPGCTQSGSTVTCTVGTVAKGGSAPVTIVLSGAADTSGTFTVSSSVDYNPNISNSVITLNTMPSISSDGPMPPWAYVLTGLSFLWIGRKQLASSGRRSS